MRKLFICFVGTDGSGKSTLVNNVFNRMQKTNMRVIKRYGRFIPILIRPIITLGRKIFFKNDITFNEYERYLIMKKAIYKKRFKLVKAYFYLLTFDYFFQILFKIAIPHKFGYSIICDRYIYDTIINDMAVDSDLTLSSVHNILSRFWSLFPKPDLVFLLNVPEQVAMNRKTDIPSFDYLVIRNQFYRRIASLESFIALDGMLSFSALEEEVFREIAKIRD